LLLIFDRFFLFVVVAVIAFFFQIVNKFDIRLIIFFESKNKYRQYNNNNENIFMYVYV